MSIKTDPVPTLQNLDKLASDGWVLLPSILNKETVQQLASSLEVAQTRCAEHQRRNKVEVNTDGTSHHIILHSEVMLDFLGSAPLHQYLTRYFEGNYIVNSFGGVINVKDKTPYVCNVHRDIKYHTNGLHMMINMLVMLDDFTLQNGATHLLTGSHNNPTKPSDEDFFSKADRCCGSAGDVVLFDSNLWHCAGKSASEVPRRCLTITYTRPSLKQQLDYPRAFGDREFSPILRQILGYNARVPCSLDEWYQPRENRLYKADQ